MVVSVQCKLSVSCQYSAQTEGHNPLAMGCPPWVQVGLPGLKDGVGPCSDALHGELSVGGQTSNQRPFQGSFPHT